MSAQHPIDPQAAENVGTGNLQPSQLAPHPSPSPSSTCPSTHSSAFVSPSSSTPPQLEPSSLMETSLVDIPDEVLGLVYSLLDPISRRALMHTCRAFHASPACLHQITRVRVLLGDPANRPHDQLGAVPVGANISSLTVCVPAGGPQNGTGPLPDLWAQLWHKPWHFHHLSRQITAVEAQAELHLSTSAAQNMRLFLGGLPSLHELRCSVMCLDELALPCLLEGGLPELTSLSLTINTSPHPLSEDDLHSIARISSLQSLKLELSSEELLDLSALCFLTHLTSFHHEGREGLHQTTPEGYGTLHDYDNVPAFLAACPYLMHLRLDHLMLPLADLRACSDSICTLSLNVCGLRELGLLSRSFPRLHSLHVNYPDLKVGDDPHALVSALQHFQGGQASPSFSCYELGIEGEVDGTPADPLFALLPQIAPLLPMFDRLYVYKLALGAEQLAQLLLLLKPRVLSSLHLFCCALAPPGLLHAVSAVNSLRLVKVTAGKYGDFQLPDISDAIHAAASAEQCKFDYDLYALNNGQKHAMESFYTKLEVVLRELVGSRLSITARCL